MTSKFPSWFIMEFRDDTVYFNGLALPGIPAKGIAILPSILPWFQLPEGVNLLTDPDYDQGVSKYLVDREGSASPSFPDGTYVDAETLGYDSIDQLFQFLYGIDPEEYEPFGGGVRSLSSSEIAFKYPESPSYTKADLEGTDLGTWRDILDTIVSWTGNTDLPETVDLRAVRDEYVTLGGISLS